MIRFSDEAWQRTARLREAIHRLPFNTELAAGSLAPDRFRVYIVQDALYLGRFSRALAIAAAKAPDSDAMQSFAHSALSAVAVEQALHGRYLREFGIDPAGIGDAEASLLESADLVVVGGPTHAFARGKPVLEHMGKRIVHCGEAGNGQVAKICNNMILGASMIAVSEAFVLGEKLGLSHQAMFDVVSASSGQCWSLTSYCPVPGPVPASPANNGYKAGFTAALMLKDLKLAKTAADSAKVETAIGTHAAQIYQRFAQEGDSALDFSAIINLVRKQSEAR